MVFAVNAAASALHAHPLYAAGNVSCPELAVPPVPTTTTNAAVPLLELMFGDVPNPDEIVGAVAEINNFPLILVSVVESIDVNFPVLGAALPMAGGDAR